MNTLIWNPNRATPWLHTLAAGGMSLCLLSLPACGGGNSTLALEGIAVPPSIEAGPVQAVSTPGGEARFSVRADGTALLYYQWQYQGQPLSDHAAAPGQSGIEGSHKPTLVIRNVQPRDVGSYSVVVGNGVFPDARSVGAALGVSQLPAAL